MWGGFNSFRDPTRNAVLTSRFMEEDLKRNVGQNISNRERMATYVVIVLLTGMICGILALFKFG
jgi:CHASE3 domain sensor protein